MTWIGLREPNEPAIFRPDGLAPSHPAPFRPQPVWNPDSILSRGTLMAEFFVEPSKTRQNLLRYSARHPWLSSLTICIDPDNRLHLLTGQADRSVSASLPITLNVFRQPIVLTYAWDGPARRAVCSAYFPDTGDLHFAEIADPLPLSLRDAERIITHQAQSQTAVGLRFLAISDQMEPIGPPATLGKDTIVTTMAGPKTLQTLRPGDLIQTADGDLAQVRWIGQQELPARGSFAPHIVRAPYYGLTRDILTSPEQRLRLDGSRIEYLFGEEAVFAKVRDLADAVSILKPRNFITMHYYQVLLDRHAIINASGGFLDSLDASYLYDDPAVHRYSMLRELPVELMPDQNTLELPVLRNFEATTLVN